MASVSLNQKFKDEIITRYPLDEAIDFIASNLNPEDVFDEKILAYWATSNGFKEEN